MPITTVVSENGNICVRVPLDGDIGTAFYTFSEVESFKSHEIECIVGAEVFLIGSKESEQLSSRLNVLSLSARDGFLRALGKILPGKIALDKSFNQAIEVLKETLRKVQHSHWFEEVSPEEAEMLFEPFLVKRAPNIFFGKGGGGKTYTCLRLALSLSSGKEFMGLTPKHKVKTLFLDYEDNAATFTDRIYRLCSGGMKLDTADVFGQIRYMNAKGVPLPDLVNILKGEIQEHGIGLLIIDSAVAACGGAPEDADSARRYFSALAKLDITSLTIAHETKSENHNYPFGSVFWYNFPRNIWNVRSVQDQDDELSTSSSVIETGLFHRKANNGPRFSPIPLKVEFKDTEKSVTIARGDLSSFQDELSPKNRIKAFLRVRPMDTGQIIEALPDLEKGNIQQALHRMESRGEIQHLGGGTKGSPWELVSKL